MINNYYYSAFIESYEPTIENSKSIQMIQHNKWQNIKNQNSEAGVDSEKSIRCTCCSILR